MLVSCAWKSLSPSEYDSVATISPPDLVHSSVKNWVTVLDKTISTFDKDTIFVFGHAFDPEKVTGNKEDLKAMQDYLSKMLVFVDQQIKAGKTKEEILKEKAIPGVTEWQGDGIERGLDATYEELKQA